MKYVEMRTTGNSTTVNTVANPMAAFWLRKICHSAVGCASVDAEPRRNAGAVPRVQRILADNRIFSGVRRFWVPGKNPLSAVSIGSLDPTSETGFGATDDRTETITRFRQWRRRWQKRAPNALSCLERDMEELPAFFPCP